jgi:hypothetical protein
MTISNALERDLDSVLWRFWPGNVRPGEVARATGLEPATSGVTGRHSNQLSYARALDRRSGEAGFTRGSLTCQAPFTVNSVKSAKPFVRGTRAPALVLKRRPGGP